MKSNVIRRVWAWIMVACMLFTMVPAFAEDTAAEVEAPAPVETVAEEPASEPAAEPAAEAEAEAPAEEPIEEAPAEEAPAEEAPAEEPSEEATIEAVPAELPEVIEELVIMPANDGIATIAAPCPAGTHVWDDSKTVVAVEGDCTTDRQEDRYCKTCGNTIRVNLGHHHDYVYTVLAADCENPERHGYVCSNPNSNCVDGPNNTPAIDPTRPMETVGQALGHKYDKEITSGSDPKEYSKAATCTDAGWTVWECTRENCPGNTFNDKPAKPAKKSDPIPALGHEAKDEPEPITLPANCTQNERYQWKCKHAGCTEVVKTEDVPDGGKMTGHNFSIDSGAYKPHLATNTHYRKCTNPNCTLPAETVAGRGSIGDHNEVVACTMKVTETIPATCVDGTKTIKECPVCGNKQTTVTGSANPSNHDWGYYDPDDPETEISDTIQCEKPTKVLLKCKNPKHTQAVTNGTQTITIHHDWELTSTTPATCQTAGHRDYTCKRGRKCDGTSGATKQEVIPIDVNAHDWDEPTREPETCTEDAKWVRKCTHYGNNNCKGMEVLDTFEGTAKGHSYQKRNDQGQLVLDKSDAELNGGYYPATDDPTNGYIKATCTKDGKLTYTCTVCQPTDPGHTFVLILQQTGHKAPPTGAEYENRTCTHADRWVAECTECGEPIPELSYDDPNGRPATGHKIDAAGWTHDAGTGTSVATKDTSTHSGKCLNEWCDAPGGTVSKEPCTFEYVRRNANCYQYAAMVYRCTVCGWEIEDRVLDRTYDQNVHDWVNGTVAITDATCTSNGVRTIKCYNYAKCKGIKTETIPGGHQWVAMSTYQDEFTDYTSIYETDDKEATCAEAGKVWQVCSRPGCKGEGATKTVNLSVVTNIDGKSNPGSPDAAARLATIPATGNHNYEPQEVTQATCLKNATTGGFKCHDCGQYDPNRMPGEIAGTALGHKWDAGIETIPASCTAGGETTYTCTRTDCDGWDSTPGADNKDATGSTTVGAAVKAVKIVKTEPTAHTPSEDEHYYEADCLNPDRWVIECTVCGAVINTIYKEDGHAAYGHNFTNVPWTYDAKGNGTHSRTCSRCSETISVPCANSETSVTTEANCTNPAGTTYTCYVCGHERFVASGTAKDPNKHVEVVERYTTNDGSDYGPTCTDVGIGVRVCKLCNKKLGYERMNADHVWDAGVITKDATCTEKGVMTYTCTKGTACSEYKNGKAATKTQDIPATGHAWDEGRVSLEPTCSAPGKKTQTCQLCGETQDTDIPTTGHTWVKNVPDNSKTALVDYCSVCGKVVFNSWIAGVTPEEKNCANVKVTVHNVDRGLDPVHVTEERGKIEATPDAPGHEPGTYCTRCERYITGGEEIPYVPEEHTQHVWAEQPVPDGTMSYMVTYCVVCGEVYTPLNEEGWLIEEGRDCEKVYYEFEGEKHYAKHAEAVSETEPGFTAGTKCPACGKWLTGHAPIEEDCEHAELYKQLAAGTLKPVEDSVVPATCVAKAKATFVCPTCSEEVENVEYGEVDTKFGHNYVKSHQGDVITYDETKGVVAAATCTKAKTTTYTCTLCEATVAGHSTAVTDGAALGHSWERNGFDITLEANRTDANGWKVDEEAKPGVAGKGHYECTECDEHVHSADVTIAALPVEPSFQEYTVTLNADAPLRETASSFSSQKQLVPEGTTVTVTGEAEGAQKNFYPVRLADGTTGYMSSSYLVGLK